MHKLYLTGLLLATVQLAFGQYQIGLIPRVSPDKAVYQKIGYTEVEIKYGSPSVKDRQIWGALVPYDKVWRAGSNSATTIDFSSSVKVANTTLDSGSYSFFIIPREDDKWTIIFNKEAKQWGAFRYDKKEDALRLDISPRRMTTKKEKLEYSIDQVGYKYGSILLSWEFIELEVPFETNYLNEFQLEVESKAASQEEYLQWITYIQGAEHLEEISSNIDVAMKWVNSAEEIMGSTTEWNDQFYPRDYVKGHLYWTKAKVLAWSGNYQVATQYINLIQGLDNKMFYDRKKESEGIDEWYEAWLEEVNAAKRSKK